MGSGPRIFLRFDAGHGFGYGDGLGAVSNRAPRSMNDSEPRSVDAADMLRDAAVGKALLALNNAHAQELSWLEAERLEYLISEAFLARRIGRLDAFLLAFDQDARYDSPNFIWFRARYPRFVYVDGSWCGHRPADAVVRDGCMPTCSNTSSTPDMIVSSARSTNYAKSRIRCLPCGVGFARSAPPASTAAAGRFATCRKR